MVRAILHYAMPFLFPYTQDYPFAVKPLDDFYFFYIMASVMSIVTFARMVKLGKMWYNKTKSPVRIEKGLKIDFSPF